MVSDEGQLVLASASPRRRELLSVLNLPFEVVTSKYDEIVPEAHPDPAVLAVDLARGKALEVAERRADALVIGADTVVALGERIYGKPVDPADAARMLRELSAHTHEVLTGVAVVVPAAPEPQVFSFASTTRVTFRPLDLCEIDAYVATGEPMDKAGGYAIQGCGALLVDSISGDYSNVVGLPIGSLALLLRRLGVRILGLP
jgi:septum formation protein